MGSVRVACVVRCDMWLYEFVMCGSCADHVRLNLAGTPAPFWLHYDCILGVSPPHMGSKRLAQRRCKVEIMVTLHLQCMCVLAVFGLSCSWILAAVLDSRRRRSMCGQCAVQCAVDVRVDVRSMCGSMCSRCAGRCAVDVRQK